MLIAPDLKAWAHEVRLIGKDGAHADVPSDVTETDADDVVEFVDAFLNYLYVLTDRLKRRNQPSPKAT
ncbi:MAG: DUF4145 domain-containing protein [Flavobacteriales bacterium]|nr:DUF4145 domain-containing protein [Flavobacteriales bacterium]